MADDLASGTISLASENPNADYELLRIKVGCLFLIWVVGFLGGIVPQYKRGSAKLLQLGNCFSGGVFLVILSPKFLEI